MADNGSVSNPTVFMPEDREPQFPYPSTIFQTDLPLVDKVCGGKGEQAIGAIATIFSATCDDNVAKSCAHALGILPSWLDINVIPASRSGLEVRSARVRDRSGMISASHASVDRVYFTRVLENGDVVAHHATNCRITDWARNWARSYQPTARQGDLLECAVVVNNAIRSALDSEAADEILQKIESLVFDTVDEPQFRALGAIRLYDFTQDNSVSIGEDQRCDGYLEVLTNTNFGQASVEAIRNETKRPL